MVSINIVVLSQLQVRVHLNWICITKMSVVSIFYNICVPTLAFNRVTFISFMVGPPIFNHSLKPRKTSTTKSCTLCKEINVLMEESQMYLTMSVKFHSHACKGFGWSNFEWHTLLLITFFVLHVFHFIGQFELNGILNHKHVNFLCMIGCTNTQSIVQSILPNVHISRGTQVDIY